jgi:RNA polymerase sigma-70 factor, ECF subfamily
MVEPMLTDTALAWVATRDEASARALMEGLYPQVIRIVRNHLPYRTDEADLAQDIFARIFANLPRWQPQQPVEHWVGRVALNLCRDQLRARKRRPEYRWTDLSEGEQRAFDSAVGESEPNSSLASDARSVLYKLLDGLNPADRQVITLLHLEEKSVAEISALTGWTKVMVKVRAFRARKKLQSALRALEGEGDGSEPTEPE